MSNARNLARLLPNASGQLPDAAMSSGSVIQVVQSITTTAFSTTSTSLVAAGLSATITPQNSSSKILCLFEGRIYIPNASNECKLALLRGASILFGGSTLYNGSSNVAGTQGFRYLDSPATGSPITYSISISSYNGNSVVLMPGGAGDGVASLTLMEIAG